jgi:putative membrane protein
VSALAAVRLRLPRPAGALLPPALAAALVATAIAYPLTAGGARLAVTWAIVLLGAALSAVHASLSRGPVAGLAVVLLVLVTAVAVEALGLATGFPYGRYRYGAGLGPAVLSVPLLVPLAWLMMAWPSWVLAGRLVVGRDTGPRRILRIGVAAVLFAAWDVVLDPQMVQAGYWTWLHPRPGLPGIGTVPLTNLVGWLLAGLVLMALLGALLGRVPSGTPRVGDAAPLVAFGWMTLGGALAHAGWLGLPGSAAWGAGLAIPVVLALAVQHRRAVAGRRAHR